MVVMLTVVKVDTDLAVGVSVDLLIAMVYMVVSVVAVVLIWVEVEVVDTRVEVPVGGRTLVTVVAVDLT